MFYYHIQSRPGIECGIITLLVQQGNRRTDWSKTDIPLKAWTVVLHGLLAWPHHK